ncbi:MAG: HepT-like ribonuclease domain-containing protein [Lawsonibacter sp.]
MEHIVSYCQQIDRPWRQIKAMRNIVAHSYGTVDPETTWEIITDDIPALKKYCEAIIQPQEIS